MLFNAEDILKDDAKIETLNLDFLVIPDDEDVPELVVKVNKANRESAKKAAHKNRNVNMKNGLLVNDQQEYAKAIIRAAYVSDTLISGGNSSIFCKMLDKNPAIAAKIAGLLSDIFDGSEIEVKEDEEEDRKN